MVEASSVKRHFVFKRKNSAENEFSVPDPVKNVLVVWGRGGEGGEGIKQKVLEEVRDTSAQTYRNVNSM